MTRCRRIAAVPLLLLLLGACAAGPPDREAGADGAVSPEARALIAEGDAAKARADALRAEAAALRAGSGRPETGPADWAEGGTRSAPVQANGAETEAGRAAAIAARLEAAGQFDARAEDAWEEALALDADAQRQIMERMLGSAPES